MQSPRDFRSIGEFAVDAVEYATRHGVHPDVLSNQIDGFCTNPDRLARLSEAIFGLRVGRLTSAAGQEWLLAIDLDDIYLRQLMCVAILRCDEAQLVERVSTPEVTRRINHAICQIIRSSRLVRGG